MWTKLSKETSLSGREPRTKPAVSRTRTGGKAATLILPKSYVNGPRANVYSDGNGKLAFALGEKGEFAVWTNGGKTSTSKVTIPTRFADRIPYGVTDVSLTIDGDMLVLDLSQLPQARLGIAAE
jgi:hypothetical protein